MNFDDGQITIRAEPFQMEARDAAQLLARIVERGSLRACGGDGFAHTALENRAQDLLFTFEVEIDRAVCDASDARHVGHLRVEVTVRGEDFRGGAQDGLALVRHGGALARIQGTCGTHAGDDSLSFTRSYH
jgi:hypothetical protein